LFWSDDRLDVAVAVRDRMRSDVGAWGVPGTVNLIGALSVPGLLTKGDVDLHLCVAVDAYDDAVATLAGHLRPTERAAWSVTLRVFAPHAPSDPPVGLAVTPHDSEHDRRFLLAWRHIRESTVLRQRSNELKGAAPQGYLAAKNAFFVELQARTDAAGPLGGVVCRALD
jgi:hypothetical protein